MMRPHRFYLRKEITCREGQQRKEYIVRTNEINKDEQKNGATKFQLN